MTDEKIEKVEKVAEPEGVEELRTAITCSEKGDILQREKDIDFIPDQLSQTGSERERSVTVSTIARKMKTGQIKIKPTVICVSGYGRVHVARQNKDFVYQPP